MGYIRTAKVLIFASITVMCQPLSAQNARDYDLALTAWAEVLASYVDAAGRIDFNGVADDASGLEQYVAVVAAYGPRSHPADFTDRNRTLAYHANTYNALAMWGVIERGIPEGFTSFFKRASFFRFRAVTIDGKKTNLYDYENQVIRPLDEPRLHFALNCMVRDCPRLPQLPFAAQTLDTQLEAAAIEFFQQPRNLRVENDKKIIMVSSILDFYTRDFVASGKADDLPVYINRYLENPLPEDYKLRFIDYDWRLNDQARSQ